MCFIFTASLVFILDRLSKVYISSFLPRQESYPLIKGVFHLTLVKNRGAAFGLLPGYPFLFLVFSLLAVIFILFLYLRRRVKTRPEKISLGLILGGTLGNLWDRLTYGAVIDFLDFRVWPVFNLADSAISIGIILFAWISLKGR